MKQSVSLSELDLCLMPSISQMQSIWGFEARERTIKFNWFNAGNEPSTIDLIAKGALKMEKEQERGLVIDSLHPIKMPLPHDG